MFCAVCTQTGHGEVLTLRGVGVSSHRLRRPPGVAPSAPRPGVASQRPPGVALPPGVAPGVASAAPPGVASQRLTDGVASTASQSDTTFAFFLHCSRHETQQNDATAHELSKIVRASQHTCAIPLEHRTGGNGGRLQMQW